MRAWRSLGPAPDGYDGAASTNRCRLECVQIGRSPARALDHVQPQRLIIAPDCGMKYLSRQVGFAKLQAMVDGTWRVRTELA